MTGTSVGEATTVHDFLEFVLDKKGGQASIAEKDYLELPKEPLAEAREGAELIAID
jgi:ABC-type Fe3+ transport system substrate-binding protein